MRQHHHHDVTDTFAHSAKSPAKHQTSGIKVSSRTKFKLKFTMTSMEVLFDNEKNFKPFKVVYQGVPGAYSEKALRELLGPHCIPIGKDSFEDTFKAVAGGQADYAVIPIENSLGGSIHANYDLLFRYDYTNCN